MNTDSPFVLYQYALEYDTYGDGYVITLPEGSILLDVIKWCPALGDVRYKALCVVRLGLPDTKRYLRIEHIHNNVLPPPHWEFVTTLYDPRDEGYVQVVFEDVEKRDIERREGHEG